MKHITLFLSFLFSGWSLEVGVVRYANLFLLHPAMKHYHFGVHNFYRQSYDTKELTDQSVAVALKDLRDLYIDHQSTIEELRKQQSQRQKELYKDLVSHTNDWQERAKLNQLQKQLEEEYGLSYQSTKRDLDQRVTKLVQELFSTSDERRLKMVSISTDIQKSIEIIRQRKGMDFVARRSDKLLLPVNWKINLDIKSLCLDLEKFQDGFLSRFLNKNSDQISLQLIKASGHSSADMRIVMLNNVHVDSLIKYLNKYLASEPANNVLGRVTDITAEVLREIYEQNGYGEDQFTVISEVLEGVIE